MYIITTKMKLVSNTILENSKSCSKQSFLAISFKINKGVDQNKANREMQ